MANKKKKETKIKKAAKATNKGVLKVMGAKSWKKGLGSILG